MNTIQSLRGAIKAIFSLVAAQNWADALIQCRELIAQGCNDARVFFVAGLSLWKQGENAEAVKFLGEALAADPNFSEAPLAHNCLGLEYRRQATAEAGSPNGLLLVQAIEHFQTAIALDKKGQTGVYRNSIAGCLALLGHLEEAVTCYDEAIAYGYRHPEDARYNKGQCQVALGLHEAAYQTFGQVLEVNPEHGKAALCMAKLQLNELALPTDSVEQTIEVAIPALTAELEAVRSNVQCRRPVYVVSPNQFAVLREEDAQESALADIAQAHGLAAVVHARRGDWRETEASIRTSRSYVADNQFIYPALWFCRELGEDGGLELYDRLIAEVGPPHRADAHYSAGGMNCGDSGRGECFIGSPGPRIQLSGGSVSEYDFPVDNWSVFDDSRTEFDILTGSDSSITGALDDEGSEGSVSSWDGDCFNGNPNRGTGSVSWSGFYTAVQ